MTKFRNVPCAMDIKYINETCDYLIENKIKGITDMFMSLWYLNCSVYSAITGWIKINNIKHMETTLNVNKQNTGIPKCIVQIDYEIKTTRSIISKTVAELQRIQSSGRMTRKGKRNREEIRKHCDGEISLYSLTCYICKLKSRLKYLSRKRKRKLKAASVSKLNNDFKNMQGKVFSKFSKFLENDPDNMRPVYMEHAEIKRYFDNPAEVETFWGNLWKSPDIGNPNAEWLTNFQEKFAELVPNIYEGDLHVTPSICIEAIKKKKNWTSAGPDKIVNFWWKKLRVVTDFSAHIFDSLIK